MLPTALRAHIGVAWGGGPAADRVCVSLPARHAPPQQSGIALSQALAALGAHLVLMAYPFPRGRSENGGYAFAVAAPCVPPSHVSYTAHGLQCGQPCPPLPTPPPPAAHGCCEANHQQPQPAPPPPSDVQRKPANHGGSSSPDVDGIQLNEGLIALFAGMENRRAAKLSKQQQQRPGAPAALKVGAEVMLPAQEDAAARAAQSERQQVRQRKERLYGARAAEVRALEATLNRSFDRAVRMHQPPLWPSVPLSSASRRIQPVQVA